MQFFRVVKRVVRCFFFLNTYFEGEWDLTVGLRSFVGCRRVCQQNPVAGKHTRGAHGLPLCFRLDPHVLRVGSWGTIPTPVSSDAVLLGF